MTYALRPGESLLDDEIEQFTNHNAPFNAWPYWREFASNIAERADLPRIVAPMFRVPATTRPEPEGQTEETGSAKDATSE